jgi:hypothetical protein
MNQSPALYAPLTSATPATEGERRPAALWVSVMVLALLGIFALVALASDFSLTPDQRTQIFEQSGMYP